MAATKEVEEGRSCVWRCSFGAVTIFPYPSWTRPRGVWSSERDNIITQLAYTASNHGLN